MKKIGIIGGSALYNIEGLKISKKKRIKTPFGDPSDEFVFGELAGKQVIFLPRHGSSHSLLPTEINNKANIYAFKILDVDRVISVSAVGSLKEEILPLDVVLVDQFVDRTNQARLTTFFGEGIVAHIPFAEPICAKLKKAVYENNQNLGVKIHGKGTYLNMEGPAFSTKAESHLYRSWGMDIIGMTNMPEARLAREAGICYATMAMVTDYDCWRAMGEEETVSVEMVMENLRKNVDTAKKMLSNTIRNMADDWSCPCGQTLKHAIVTPKAAVPKATLKKLKPLIEGVV
ncbi:MAG: S-methyl-5'-thioadenosine phosphorylase [Candidatus Omnitrophota bacterium]